MKIIRFVRKHSKTIAPAAASLVLVLTSAALASSGGDHGAAAPKGWVATDTYKVMNFAVLAIALFFIARKPVAAFFSSRVQDIREELADLEKQKKEAQERLDGYADRLAKLEKESSAIVDEYVKQGEAAKKRILAEAQAQAEKLEDTAKRNIEQEFKSARLKLQQEIADKALVKAEALVKEAITAQDQDRLVDEYLNKVVAS